jgi:hypothetical protein
MSGVDEDSEALACGNPGDVLFAGLVLSAIIFNGTSWWRFGKSKGSLENTREFITLLAIAANSLALFAPVVFAFSMSLQVAVGLNGLLYAILGLSLFSLLATFFVPKQLRATLFFGNLATGLLWLMVPRAVL